MGGIFGRIFGRRETPIEGIVPRLKNIATVHYRGILGVLLPLCAMPPFGKKDKPELTVQLIWMWIVWFFLLQPVSLGATGSIPIFVMPMAGVMNTVDTCQCYLNENIMLLFVGTWLHMLFNVSGIDKRVVCFFLCYNPSTNTYSTWLLMIRAAAAAFFTSAISSSIFVTPYVLKCLDPALTALSRRNDEGDYKIFHSMMINLVHTSAAIGSICVMHASIPVLTFRAIWCESAGAGKEFPDIFNYLQYSAYAVPTALVMLLCNIVYHYALTLFLVHDDYNPMSVSSMNQVKKNLAKERVGLGEMSRHESLSVLFYLAAMSMLFTRWCKWINMGWATFSEEVLAPTIPGVKDATTVAFFAFILHVMPKGFGFLNLLFAKSLNEVKKAKVESAILFWKFIDKHTPYAMFLVMGCGVALYKAAIISLLSDHIPKSKVGEICDMSWLVSVLLVVLTVVALANIMSGTAACAVLCPYLLLLAHGSPNWSPKAYLIALGAGVGSNLGFIIPFMMTPAYYARHVSKMTWLTQIKYGLPSAIICGLVLWISLCFYAPVIWDPNGSGFASVNMAGPIAAPEGGGGEEAAPAEERI